LFDGNAATADTSMKGKHRRKNVRHASTPKRFLKLWKKIIDNDFDRGYENPGCNQRPGFSVPVPVL